MAPEPCAFDGCKNSRRRKGLCWSHWKQGKRKGRLSPLREYGLSASEQLKRAIARYSNAEGDQEYERARVLLAKYMYGKVGKRNLSHFVQEAAKLVQLLERGQFPRKENVHIPTEALAHGLSNSAQADLGHGQAEDASNGADGTGPDGSAPPIRR